MAIKRLCPRCKRVINDSQKYCISCITKVRTEADKRYDRFRRNKDSRTFYNSKPWKIKRQQVLAFYLNLDLYQLYIMKKIVTADTVHHIHELIDEPDRALDDDNLIPLSASTHDLIHGMYKEDKTTTMLLLEALKERWEKEIKGDIEKVCENGHMKVFRIGGMTYEV